jgi:hypothetical protein
VKHERDARLREWLSDPGKTWRWNRGEVEGYRAVELRGDRLRWFQWSHEIADGEGGAQGEVWQGVEDFLASGPGIDGVPEGLVASIRAHLETRR